MDDEHAEQQDAVTDARDTDDAELLDELLIEQQDAVTDARDTDDAELLDELLIEEISIDGMCGVY
jgi:mycofactocin precursor